MMKKFFQQIFFAAAMSLLFSMTATASTVDCPDGSVCVWDDVNFEGALYKLWIPDIQQLWVNLPVHASVFNDRISSIWNRSKVRFCFYVDAGWTGASFPLDAGSALSYVGHLGPSWNDQISSFRPCN
jgi:hypothetical protein